MRRVRVKIGATADETFKNIVRATRILRCVKCGTIGVAPGRDVCPQYPKCAKKEPRA